MDIISIVLAAGMGTRMKSKTNKNLHKLAGKPMVSHVIDAVEEAVLGEIVLVIGKDASQVRETLGERFKYVYQKELLGTGHAVMQAEPLFAGKPEAIVIVVFGDCPLITAKTLQGLVLKHQESEAAATLLVDKVSDPTGLGRILRAQDGSIINIVEEADATSEQKEINEVWTGFACFNSHELANCLKRINNDNAQGEYYLPDTIRVMADDKKTIASANVLTPGETMNVNDRVSLAQAEEIMQKRCQKDIMSKGVTIVSPQNTIIEKGVTIGQDSVIMPFTYLAGSTTIGCDSIVGPYSHLTDCQVGDRVTIERSTLLKAEVDSDVTVGPFAYLRPGTKLGEGSKAGRFVEIKNSNIGTGSKVPHLSYVGDADVGANVNFGAGTIVVNYDGRNKHRTTVADNAFIGCNANLVSPVKIGEEAYVAAGSTITDDVPSHSLAIARQRQSNKKDWVVNKHKEWEGEE